MLRKVQSIAFLSLLATAACGGDDDDDHDDDHDHDDEENEVITSVILTFTPDGGGTALFFEFDDPDGDGGNEPTVDDIDLAAGTYAVDFAVENRLEDPAEDITEEIDEEADEHQVFFTGTAVDGPATDNSGAPLTHSYGDQDSNGYPIGLTNTFAAVVGTGNLIVTLRHLPPVNDTPVKTGTLAADVQTGGLTSIPGSSDVQVTFAVNVAEVQ